MSMPGLAERAYYLFHRRGDIVAGLLAHLPREKPHLDVLDFGGGTGWISRALAKVQRGTYTVADVDRSALRRASGSASLHPVLVPSEGPLPFPSGSFDCILVVDVLHHLPDAPASLRDLARCLRRGGRILIIEFDADHVMTRLFRTLSRYRPHPCVFWSPDNLSLLCKSLGLVTSWERVDGLRHLVRASRPSEAIGIRCGVAARDGATYARRRTE